MRRSRDAKIVASVGPATSSPESRADTFRLNLSQGAHDDHASVLASIRALEREFNRPIGMLQDLQGPKIRVAGSMKASSRWMPARPSASH